MHRIMFTLAAVIAALAIAGPAQAFQCPKLIAQITDATGNRFDAAANDAKAKAAVAQKLHAEGKHEESVKAAQEGLKLLGMEMKMEKK
jgi:hypothetical protein